jgi:diguanylate cyclase (GGDEF)-like protein/PAS domain S-box-containing protein
MSDRRASRLIIFYAFFLVIAIMMAITSLGLSRIHNLSTDLENVVHEHDVQIALMHTMRHVARERSILLQSMMILQDPFVVDEYAMKMGEAAGLYMTARTRLLAHRLTTEERELLERQQKQTNATATAQAQAIEYVRNGEYAAAATLLINTTLPGQRRAMEMMDEFIYLKRRQNLASLNATSKTIEQTYSLMVLLGIFGVLFSIGVAYSVSRRIIREIELRKNSENELRHSELRERTIRENIIDGVLTLDARGTILSCNKACKQIFGYQHHELMHRSAHILMPAAIIDASKDDLGRHLEQWEKRMIGVGREVVGRRCDGSSFPAELDISKITLDGEPVYIAVIRDITEKKEAEKRLQHFNQELERRVLERTTELANTNGKLRHEINERVKVQYELTHLATHDSLTSLPNRSMFTEHLEIMLHAASRHNRILALFFMDLDGFKAVNDSHGHEVGDKLLVEIAARLRRCVRKEDVVARMGGDEFTVLLGEVSEVEDVHVVAQQLIEAVNRPVRIGDHICHIGISIGISLFPRCASDADMLLRLADNAMYAAKEAGKNTYSFSLPDSGAAGSVRAK